MALQGVAVHDLASLLSGEDATIGDPHASRLPDMFRILQTPTLPSFFADAKQPCSVGLGEERTLSRRSPPATYGGQPRIGDREGSICAARYTDQTALAARISPVQRGSTWTNALIRSTWNAVVQARTATRTATTEALTPCGPAQRPHLITPSASTHREAAAGLLGSPGSRQPG
jgi:hypothetical protein